jgi:hypothetical protein
MHDGAPPRDRPAGRPDEPADASDPPAPDARRLAQDWITLWQSELTATAADRECAEVWQTLIGLWAGMAGAIVQHLPQGVHDTTAPSGRAGAAASSRPAPAAAAPDPRDAEIERLAGQIADLERRLAALERGDH